VLTGANKNFREKIKMAIKKCKNVDADFEPVEKVAKCSCEKSFQ
jgi:hypothetical protein